MGLFLCVAAVTRALAPAELFSIRTFYLRFLATIYTDCTESNSAFDPVSSLTASVCPLGRHD